MNALTEADTLRPASAASVADLIPILAYEAVQGLFFGTDGTLSFGFLCRPLPGGDDKVEAKIRSLLEEDWPDDAVVQFSLLASPNLVRAFGSIEALRRGTTGDLLKTALRARTEFFAAAADRGFAECEGRLHLRDFVLSVVGKIPIAGIEPSAAELERAFQLKERAGAALGHAGLVPRPIGANEFVTLLSTYVNRSRHASWRVFGGDAARDDVTLNHQVFDRATDICVERSGLWLDDVRVSVLSAKQMPDVLPWGLSAWLLGDALTGARGLRGPFSVTLSVHFPAAAAFRSKLITKRQWVTNSAFGPMQKWLPNLVVQQRDLDLIGASMENGHRPIRYNLTLCLYSQPADPAASFAERLRSARQAALAAESNARTFWAERGFTLMADQFVCLPLFVAALPFCSDRRAIRDTGRFRTATTEHVSRFVPLFADWRGTGTPAINLVGRNGQLMDVCLFDSQTNYNTVIAAQSGSGKSFLANNLIESYLGMGAYVWVIDAGYSYLKLAEELGGDFIDFAPDRPVSLNPFPIVRDYDEEGDILEAVVTAMAAPTEPLTDLQSSVLKRTMRELWSELGKETSIDALAERLSRSDDERVRDIGTRLYGFTGEGAYGRYFHGPNTVSFRSRFTVLELDQLRSRKHLQQVVLLMLIYAVQQQMHALPRGTKKIVLIDEAWELLGEGEVGRFIEHAYRRFRKYNGAAVTVTQSIADFHTSASGRAVAENSANRFLLGQKSEVVDALVAANKLALSPFAIEVLKSVHTLAGQYSEIFVQTESGSGVGRLIVPPFSRLLYSTRPADLAAITAHRDRGLATPQAIMAVLAERGDPAARGGAP
jgi:conjugal transfer ATP-binding protein TraC